MTEVDNDRRKYAYCKGCGEVVSQTKQSDIKVNGNIIKTKIRCDLCWTINYIKRGVNNG